MRIGIDAFNLAADRRGMGRVARTAIARLRASGVADLSLIAKDSAAARRLEHELALPAMTPNALRTAALDAVWYPWNGMRFTPHAPAIVTVYDLFAFRFPAQNFVARLREQSPIRKGIHAARQIVTLSQWTANDLQSAFGVSADRIRICSPGIDSFWHPVDGAQTHPYILFVAGPDKRKNAAMLIEAFAAAFGRSDSPVLFVAGALSDADEKLLNRLSLSYEREKPDDERLRTLYSGALAVAVPSLAEGYGLPAVEAMACGAPVIAADATALPEACDGAALLVPPDDGAAWARMLERIARDDALRASLRERGFERVRRLNPDDLANALIEFARRSREGVR